MNSPRPQFEKETVAAAMPLHQFAEALGLVWDAAKSTPSKGDYWSSCPLHSEKSASFHLDSRKGFFYCFGCHAKGDVFALIRQVEGLDFLGALQRAAEMAGVAPIQDESPEQIQARKEARAARESQRQADELLRAAAEIEDKRRQAEVSLGWWRDARPDPSIETYLGARGVDLGLVGGVPASLRRLDMRFIEGGPRIPCMFAPVQAVDGSVTGCHRTFLASDYRGKYAAPDGRGSKKMFGACWGGAIRLAPAAPIIAIAEGIESALAFACFERRAGRSTPVWAAGSLGNIHHAITFPEGVQEVILVADNDTKHRETLEDALAGATTRLQGLGLKISRETPPRGMDFLDFWNATEGGGSETLVF